MLVGVGREVEKGQVAEVELRKKQKKSLGSWFHLSFSTFLQTRIEDVGDL